MRSRLPLNALRAFEVSARHLSFSAAAEELGVTPTAISHQIRQLEDIIGAPLFRRRPRPITLTDLGEQLLPDLSHGFDKIEQALQGITPEKPTRILKVTSTVAFAGGVLLPNLEDWTFENEDLELEIHGSDRPATFHADEVDLAIRYADGPCETLIWEPLCTDRYLPMSMPKGAGRNRLAPADLLDEPLISYRWKNLNPAEPSWEKWRSAASEQAGALPSLANAKVIRISEESNALEAALAGTGIVLASEVITRAAREKGRLEIVSEIGLNGLSYWFVYPPAARQDDRIARFRSWLSRTLALGVGKFEDEKISPSP